jgi:hypothetical protein
MWAVRTLRKISTEMSFMRQTASYTFSAIKEMRNNERIINLSKPFVFP